MTTFLWNVSNNVQTNIEPKISIFSSTVNSEYDLSKPKTLVKWHISWSQTRRAALTKRDVVYSSFLSSFAIPNTSKHVSVRFVSFDSETYLVIIVYACMTSIM